MKIKSNTKLFKYTNILLLVALCLLSFNSRSQHFNGGILGGVSASQITGDRYSGFNKAGIYVGGFVNFYFNQRSSIQMEIDYLQKGSRKNPNPDDNDFVAYKLNLQYIEIPLLLKYDYSSKIIFETGPYLSFLMKDNEQDHNGDIPVIQEFNKNDIGIMLGIYYRLNEKILMNFRYSNSLIPVRKHSSGATYWINKGQYNIVVTLSAHIQF